MKTDDYLNELIDREKQTVYNPYLATHIMAKIEVPKQRKLIVFKYITVVASISLVVIMGMAIGNTYMPATKQYEGININDSELENFALYNTNSNE